ncbi:hypothetical protein EKO04_004826 [Ascochyta lentis]|uniref:Uncharacterized protein n=1 Tax=Ascochyta lentis TaxID=205686 RepID=A0A8H7MJK7_9PLEO|nr:hypothetical protein EKO04_004826 [Ascochyta lentis]
MQEQKTRLKEETKSFTAELTKNKQEEQAVLMGFSNTVETMKALNRHCSADVERLVQKCFDEIQSLKQRHVEGAQELKAEHAVKLDRLRGEVDRAKIEGITAGEEGKKKYRELVLQLAILKDVNA